MFRDRKGMRIVGLLFVTLVYFYAALLMSSHGIQACAMGSSDSLITNAKQIAKENQIDVDNCDVQVRQKDEFIIVEFHRRTRGTNIKGGGGRIWFTEEKGKYVVHKIEFWM
jgi:hypothetical protein